MIKNQKLNIAASNFLNRSYIDPLLLSRLSSLTLTVVLLFPNEIENTCGYLLQLLTYTDNFSVFSLFESLCSENPNLYKIQKWLVELGFFKLIQKEIENISNKNILSNDNRFEELLVSYYNIIKISSNSLIFREHIISDIFFGLINRDIGEYSQYVENYRWEALSSIVSPNNIEILRGLFPIALNLLHDHDKAPTRSGCAAILILTHMIHLDPFIITFFHQVKVTQTIGNLILRFPNHSILHNYCRKYFYISLQNPITMKQTFNDCVPIIVAGIYSKNRNLEAISMGLLNDISNLEKNNENLYHFMNEVNGFIDIVKGPFSHYRSILSQNYGGEIPEFPTQFNEFECLYKKY